MAAINNLYAKFAYKAVGVGLPIIVLVHGWSNGATSFDGDNTLSRIADYGFFVAAVGMRGRNSADGSNDASGREIYDLYDVLAYIRANYASVVNTDRAAVVGFSGGGGNALAAACKFPDAFNCVVSYFGMSDYGRDAVNGWWANNGGAYTAGIETAVGGNPSTVPNAYYARDAVAAISNYSGGSLYLFHDEDDVTVPVVHSTRIAAISGESHISTAEDAVRWLHGYPADHPDLIQAEAIWKSAALNNAAWTISVSGTVTVIGYIVTKRFSIWLGNGTAQAATVVYDTVAGTYTVTPLTTGNVDVAIVQGALTASQTISGSTLLTVS